MKLSQEEIDNIKSCLPHRYIPLIQKSMLRKKGKKYHKTSISRGMMEKHQSLEIIHEARLLAKKYNPELYFTFFEI